MLLFKVIFLLAKLYCLRVLVIYFLTHPLQHPTAVPWCCRVTHADLPGSLGSSVGCKLEHAEEKLSCDADTRTDSADPTGAVR